MGNARLVRTEHELTPLVESFALSGVLIVGEDDVKVV